MTTTTMMEMTMILIIIMIIIFIRNKCESRKTALSFEPCVTHVLERATYVFFFFFMFRRNAFLKNKFTVLVILKKKKNGITLPYLLGHVLRAFRCHHWRLIEGC